MLLYSRGLLLLLLLVAAAGAATAAEITRAVVGGGGGAAGGATVAIQSTLGQPVTGEASSATMSVTAGFWQIVAAGLSFVPDDVLPPTVFRLLPNHPNPFNPRTTIAFDLPADASRVSLRIFDLRGRAVATLVDGSLPAGRHSAAWTGVDDAGRALGSGIYLARIDTGRDRAVRKLTLVR